MRMISRQFARPNGLFGRFIGRGMARSNGELSRWVVQELSHQQLDAGGRIVEIGPGPGVGLEEALQRFPQARVWGVDISPEMISQSRNRNQALIDSGWPKLRQSTLSWGTTSSTSGTIPCWCCNRSTAFSELEECSLSATSSSGTCLRWRRSTFLWTATGSTRRMIR